MAFTSLAKSILRDAEVLDEYIRTNNLPQPSFDVDAPVRTVYSNQETIFSHASLVANTHKLHRLVEGPAATWTGSINGPLGDIMTNASIFRFNIVDHVPIGSEASFEDVAAKCGLALRDFKMIVRYAMTNFIFCEPRPGFIAHTAASRALKENKLLRALTGFGVNELVPALSKDLVALDKFPGSEEPTESAWGLANDARVPMFAELAARHPKRAETMAFAMEALGSMFAPSVMVDNYDWGSLGSAKMVDVGGGKGLVSKTLAEHFPDMSFVVQDLEETVVAGRNQLSEDLKDRIAFMTHDFFTPQPVKDADVYFFRAIMHDWPKKYCIRILQNLIPALKKGAKVIILDPHTPAPLASQLWQDRIARASNLRMRMLFNSHDLEAWEWPELFAKVDARFKVGRVAVVDREPGNSVGPSLVLVEAVWEG